MAGAAMYRGAVAIAAAMYYQVYYRCPTVVILGDSLTEAVTEQSPSDRFGDPNEDEARFPRVPGVPMILQSEYHNDIAAMTARHLRGARVYAWGRCGWTSEEVAVVSPLLALWPSLGWTQRIFLWPGSAERYQWLNRVTGLGYRKAARRAHDIFTRVAVILNAFTVKTPPGRFLRAVLRAMWTPDVVVVATGANDVDRYTMWDVLGTSRIDLSKGNEADARSVEDLAQSAFSMVQGLHQKLHAQGLRTIAVTMHRTFPSDIHRAVELGEPEGMRGDELENILRRMDEKVGEVVPRFNALVRAWAGGDEAAGVPPRPPLLVGLADNFAAIPHNAETARTLYCDGCHLTPEGYARLGEGYAKAVREALPHLTPA